MSLNKKIWGKNKNTRLIKIVLIVTCLVTLVRFSGILQPLEWASYDLLYRFHPEETKDERVVVVTWTELDIQRTQNTIISDRDLSIVLNSIVEQKPRVVGLDLYRDVPEPSDLLSKEQNKKAYEELNKIFLDTDNLFVIEKARQPTINPPPVLVGSERITSSDIIVDKDRIVRRSFFDPQPQVFVEGKLVNRQVFYLGLVLGYEYIAAEGWQPKMLEEQNYSLQFSKGDLGKAEALRDHSFTIQQLKPSIGSVLQSEPGLDFLINWRKNTSPFVAVPISKILEGNISADIFRDKLVIIGNTAISTIDKHYIPLTNWFASKGEDPWTYGVYIQAHVASSIISSAMDGREQLNILHVDYYLLIFFSFLTTLIIYKYHNQSYRRLCFIGIAFYLALSVLIYIVSQFAFFFGWWIPIVPAFLSIGLTSMLTINSIQRERERKIEYKLKLSQKNLNHSLKNQLGKIDKIPSGILVYTELLKNILLEQHSDNQELGIIPRDLKFSETEEGQYFQKIDFKLQKISQIVQEAQRNRNRMSQLVTLKESKKHNFRKVSLIEYSRERINKFIFLNENEVDVYNVSITQNYDRKLLRYSIEKLPIEIILDNLIENAFAAVLARKEAQENSNYIPTISISIEKQSRYIKIIIEDNGIGISLGLQKQILNPYIFNRNFSSSIEGIGLTLVTETINLEKGKISVFSEEGKGARFEVLLPYKKSNIAT